ncbi:HipA domain-containing protein, partial [Fodinicola feengrottensis]|uniref:HipA domain-containing protein n=1 Tax=Fodinicola feengrottensis TaxID=435914 RepID=UPI0036F30D15
MRWHAIPTTCRPSRTCWTPAQVHSAVLGPRLPCATVAGCSSPSSLITATNGTSLRGRRPRSTWAQRAGIDVPARRLTAVGGRSVLMLERFDREADRRMGYISAMTLVRGQD